MSPRVLIDACVLVPTLTRQLVLACAETGAFAPLWSETILAEWRHAAARYGPLETALIDAEIARLARVFPEAHAHSETVDLPSLPDPDDAHVLAAAVSARASELLTFNTRDFPLRVLTPLGLLRRHPDEFLLELLGEPDCATAMAPVLSRAVEDTGLSRRKLLRKAQLPRFGKALDG